MSLRLLLRDLPLWITLGMRRKPQWIEGDEPSEPQRAFRCLQIELAESEESLKVATVEVSTLQALLETER